MAERFPLITIIGWKSNSVDLKGKLRALSAWRKIGKGEIILMATIEDFYSISYRDIDTFIFTSSGGDNLKAAFIVGNWLLGKINYLDL